MAKNPEAHMERNSRKLLQKLQADGWRIVRIRGSHHTLKNPKFKFPIVFTHPKKDLPIGLVREIYKAVGWRR